MEVTFSKNLLFKRCENLTICPLQRELTCKVPNNFFNWKVGSSEENQNVNLSIFFFGRVIEDLFCKGGLKFRSQLQVLQKFKVSAIRLFLQPERRRATNRFEKCCSTVSIFTISIKIII